MHACVCERGIGVRKENKNKHCAFSREKALGMVQLYTHSTVNCNESTHWFKDPLVVLEVLKPWRPGVSPVDS